MNPAGLFVNTVTVYAQTNTVAADGSYSSSGAGTTGVKCSLQPLSSSESVQYERQTSGVFARMYCGLGVAIAPDSIVVDADGVSWRVAGRGRNVGGRSVFQTVDLERIK
jgi:hypothetical protein